MVQAAGEGVQVPEAKKCEEEKGPSALQSRQTGQACEATCPGGNYKTAQRHATSRMVKRFSERIVNIASVAGKEGL